MSSDPVVEVRHVWKQFAPDDRSRARELVRRLRREPLIPGGTWALADVSLDVAPAEAVGLIGRNGSGKTTLLHVVERGMTPTAGWVRTRGRVSALIEIKAGLHLDLTGRENVEVLSTLLGHHGGAGRRHLDAIVAFAGLELAVDRQVKHYSLGMKARLGFALATVFEPQVLLVDEVLAAGDTEFQERCLARLAELQRAGTSMLYVSHDLATVEALCSRVVWLDGGRVVAEGSVADVVPRYRAATAS